MHIYTHTYTCIHVLHIENLYNCTQICVFVLWLFPNHFRTVRRSELGRPGFQKRVRCVAKGNFRRIWNSDDSRSGGAGIWSAICLHFQVTNGINR